MKPERIRKAQIQGNSEYLQAAGKKGAEVAKQNRERRKEEDDIFAEVEEQNRVFEEMLRAQAANEDKVPIEPEEDMD